MKALTQRPIYARVLALLCLVLLFLGISLAKISHLFRGQTQPIPVSKDFGNSNKFQNHDSAYSWTPVNLSYTSTLQKEVVKLPSSPLSLFSEPLQSLHFQTSAPDCDRFPYLVKAIDQEGKSYRLVIHLLKETKGTCTNSFISLNPGHLTKLETYRLTSEKQVEAVEAGDSSPDEVYFSNAFFPQDLALAFLEKLAPSARGKDFRLANYEIFEPLIASKVAEIARQASQSLILTSILMLSEPYGRKAVANWLQSDPEFPVYFVIRSSMFSPNLVNRFVMHIKGFTQGDQYGLFTSATFDRSRYQKAEVFIWMKNLASRLKLKDTLFSILCKNCGSREGQSPTEDVRIAYNYPQVFSPSTPTLDPLKIKLDSTPKDPNFRNLEFNRDFKNFFTAPEKTLVLNLIWTPDPDFWSILGSSKAKTIIILHNTDIDNPAQFANLVRRFKHEHPEIRVELIGVSSEQGYGSWVFHFRGYLVLNERCAISEASPSLGRYYSDQSIVYSHKYNSICKPLERIFKEFLGLNPPSSTLDWPDSVREAVFKPGKLKILFRDSLMGYYPGNLMSQSQLRSRFKDVFREP